MALPPELQQELKDLGDLPQVSALEQEMKSHQDLAASRAAGNRTGLSNLFNNIMIASDNLDDAARLAQAYAKSLSVQKLVREDKVVAVDWQDIFNNAAGRDMHIAVGDNLAQAFQAAEGGVLIISEPYQCPPDMSPRDFMFSNYTATDKLMKKMDEMEGFDDKVDALYEKGKDLNEIDRQMSKQDFENPSKPVVILIGRQFEMESMLAEDPYPWNMRFMHRLGISNKAAEGHPPAQRNSRKGFPPSP